MKVSFLESRSKCVKETEGGSQGLSVPAPTQPCGALRIFHSTHTPPPHTHTYRGAPFLLLLRRIPVKVGKKKKRLGGRVFPGKIIWTEDRRLLSHACSWPLLPASISLATVRRTTLLLAMQSTPNYLWKLDDVLGQGATASVYKARNKVSWRGCPVNGSIKPLGLDFVFLLSWKNTNKKWKKHRAQCERKYYKQYMKWFSQGQKQFAEILTKWRFTKAALNDTDKSSRKG